VQSSEEEESEEEDEGEDDEDESEEEDGFDEDRFGGGDSIDDMVKKSSVGDVGEDELGARTQRETDVRARAKKRARKRAGLPNGRRRHQPL
jgi:hypothetical protein